MNVLRTITSNHIINVAAISWFTAQILKLLLVFWLTRKVDWGRLTGSGGMPSSHAALVCAMVVTIARKLGFASPLFGLAFCFAIVVLYDAMGVRRAAGEQAKVLNKMIFDFPFFTQTRKGAPQGQSLQQGEEDQEATLIPEQLKELLGHTPFEVLGGCVVGILIGVLMPMSLGQ